MAVIYSKRIDGTLYEVRTAGESVRLYSNGVLHSQFNPNHPISGAIWDLLLLPAFLLKKQPKKILLLGLGGGTLVHLIRVFFPLAHITCVDLDKEHIRIAKKYFKIPRNTVTLIHGDAYQELRSMRARFDWIIDDVFQHVNGEPERGSNNYQLLNTYKKNLSSEGMLSLNVIGKNQLENINPLIRSFQVAVTFIHPLYENKIVAMFNSEMNEKAIKKGFKSQLSRFKALDQTRKTCRLNYRLRVLKCN